MSRPIVGQSKISQAEFRRLADQVAEDSPITLISREDIYSGHGQGALLMKQGTEISLDMLPRLLKCGIDPGQFVIRHAEELDPSAKRVIRSIRESLLANKRVVILDPNQKSMSRTMNALVQVGFSMGKIHPVRMAQYLGWTLTKYQPDILVIDYQISPSVNGLQILAGLDRSELDLEQIILTVPTGSVSASEEAYFMSQVQALEVDVLFKPVLATALENLVISDEL